MSDFRPNCNFIEGLSIPGKVCLNRTQNIDDFLKQHTKNIPNCKRLIYYGRPEVETSEIDCQAPACFSFSSSFPSFSFHLSLKKKNSPQSQEYIDLFSILALWKLPWFI